MHRLLGSCLEKPNVVAKRVFSDKLRYYLISSPAISLFLFHHRDVLLVVDPDMLVVEAPYLPIGLMPSCM